MKPLKLNFASARLAAGVLPACAAALLLSGCSRNVASAPQSPLASASSANDITSEKTITEPSSTSPDSTTIAPSKGAAAKASKINWLEDYDQARAQAKKLQKPVMMDFYADWCPPCKVMDAEIFPANKVVQESQHFVNVKIDIDKHPDLMKKYDVSGIPTIVFLDASGEVIYRPVFLTSGADDFAEMMQSARARATPTPA